MELMHTDLPEPVAPAISRWGIFARSETSGLPLTSLPSAMGRSALAPTQSSDSRISRRPTVVAFWLGTSTPTAALPGNRRHDADRLGAHAEGDVLVEAGNLLHADAGGGDDFVPRDDRPDVDLAQRHLHAEFTQNPQQVLGVLPMLLFARTRVDDDGFAQEGERWKLVIVVGMHHGSGLGLLGFLRFDDVELAQGRDRGFRGGGRRSQINSLLRPIRGRRPVCRGRLNGRFRRACRLLGCRGLRGFGGGGGRLANEVLLGLRNDERLLHHRRRRQEPRQLPWRR